MAETICAPDAPPSAPTLATMAVAAGAAVLAGVMMGRKGLGGVAAGVAAFAGAKWYSGTRSIEPAPARDDISAVVDLSPEVHPPKEECVDWVDHDAVEFCHVVPDSAQAAEMLQEKTLPLLDDDGKPVDFLHVAPDYLDVPVALANPDVPKALGYPDVPEREFPLGPVIWKPGRFPQSASVGTSETVWYGMQDVTPAVPAHQSPPALPAPAPPEPVTPYAPFVPEPAAPFAQVISEPTPPPLAAQSIVQEAATPYAPFVPDPIAPFAQVIFEPVPPPLAAQTVVQEVQAPLPPPPVEVPPPVPISVGLDAITRPKQASAPAGQNPFFGPVTLATEPALPAAVANPAIPFSTGAFGSSPVSFMAAADAAIAPVVTAKPAAKSSLPQPRRAGELPKHMAAKAPDSEPNFPAAPLHDQTLPWRAGAQPAQGVLCAQPAPPPQRHLERLAPVESEPKESRWPLLVLLCLVIAAALAFTANRWHNRPSPHKVEALPLLQKSVKADQTLTSPATSAPAATTEPAKRGSWIEPAPAPGN